jgi:MFS transporter, AAHS family, 4-hydroxybenzoate transporter
MANVHDSRRRRRSLPLGSTTKSARAEAARTPRGRTSSGEEDVAEASGVEVSRFIDERGVGGFQVLVAVLCGVAVFMDGFDTQMIGYVLPAIAKSLQVEPSSLTRVALSGLVGLLLGALSFGIIADRIGRKSVIVFCIAWFGLCMLLTPTASSASGLMVWRFLTGLGLGGAMPLAIALTAEYSPRRSRATVVMMMFFGFSFGAAVAGFATAALIERFGWAAVFYAGAVLPILFAPLLVAALPESICVLALRGGENARIARLLSRIDPTQRLSADTRFIIHEEQAEGLPVRHLFHEHRAVSTVLIWIMFFMNLLCLFFLASWLPTVINAAGLSVGTAAFITALLQIGGCIGTLCFGPAVDRFGAFAVLTTTYVFASVFIASIGMSGALVPLLAATTFAAGFCIVGGQNTMNALASIVYPTYIRSTGVGWALGIGRIGTLVGTAMGGALLAMKLPVPTIFLIAAAPALVTATASFLLGTAERRRYQATGESSNPSPRAA